MVGGEKKRSERRARREALLGLNSVVREKNGCEVCRSFRRAAFLYEERLRGV